MHGLLGHRSVEEEERVRRGVGIIRRGDFYNGKFTYLKHKAERSIDCTGRGGAEV